MIAERKIRIESNKLIPQDPRESFRSVVNWREKEERFGNDGFAGHKWMMQVGDLSFGPFVMAVPPVEQCHDRSRINENATRHILSSALCW